MINRFRAGAEPISSWAEPSGRPLPAGARSAEAPFATAFLAMPSFLLIPMLWAYGPTSGALAE
jgi:hypothetical protein